MLLRLFYAFILLANCVVNHVAADEIKADFSGFATLAASYSDDPDMGFGSNYINKKRAGFSLSRESILGGQVNLSLNRNWDSVAQVVLQDHASEEFDSFLELAFLRYRPSRDWAIRAGRLNSDLYLLSEYPYVGYAYLWARPPHEFYSFASAGGHFDGLDVEYTQSVFDGFLRLKLAAGQTTTKLTSAGDKFHIDFDNLITFSASYSLEAWTLRFSASRTDIGGYKLDSMAQLIAAFRAVPASLWPQAQSLAQSYDTEGKTVSYAAFGVSYDYDNWLIQSEVGISESQWLVSPSNLNAYVSVGYRFGDVTVYSGVSISENRNDVTNIPVPQFPPGIPEQITLPIQQLAVIAQDAVELPVVHQHSINIGAKWHFSDTVVIKAQIDHFDIQPYGGGLWSRSKPEDVKIGHRVNVFSLSTSLVF